MKKFVLVPFTFLMLTLLVACGGDSDSSPEVNSLTVSSVGSVLSINEQEKYNLIISGSDNTVTIKKDNVIGSLEISGTGNTLFIEDSTAISTFNVSGVGNTILVPVDSGIVFLDTGTANTLKTTTTNFIVGTWTYTYPATQCVETYDFNANGTVKGTSLDEVVVGTYTFEETVVTGDRHLLSIIFTYDNGLSDCNGLSEDSTGLSFTPYISFTNAAEIEWFDDSVGGTAIVVLTKK